MPKINKINRRKLLHIAVLIVAAFLFSGCSLTKAQAKQARKSHFTLWQLPSQSPSQMNSYVLQTQKGKIIVVDGGMKEDAAYLKGFLAALGNNVDAWFISHPHADHINGLTEILNNQGDLTIDKIYASLPSRDWVDKYERHPLSTVDAFSKAMKKANKTHLEHSVGEVIEIDRIRIEILAVRNPEITGNAVNNSSVVMKVIDDSKSVLFTGDLGEAGGKKLLKSPYREKLKADYVQMAHHGQNGVNKAFYEVVRPKYCLWPTPRWLWDNDNGGGKNSGPWVTLAVRKWMDELGVEKHYVSADGLQKIE